MKDLVHEPSEKRLLDFSKNMSYWLRHSPESIGITLDKEGYVSTTDFINSINNKGNWVVSIDILKHIVESDEKQRYSFKDNFSMIRANQGHSTSQVNLEFKKFIPNSCLFHGTVIENFDKIFESGSIKPMSRQYVHLSKDMETAQLVGGRREGIVEVLTVDAVGMQRDGYDFFESENGVILTKEVPTKYIS